LSTAWLEDARALALVPPWAHGEPLGEAEIKVTPEDFVVVEQLGFEADGGTGHVLLKICKRGRDTLAVARELARFGGVFARDVGFAGLKDRKAVATQWFTVPARRPLADWQGVEGEGYRVLAALSHSRKLRRGALKGNAFQLTLRGIEAPAMAIATRLGVLAAEGVPNYFGMQRFGRDGANLAAVERWCAAGELPHGREGRAFVYSAARSLVFNAVLARRVAGGSWNRILPGEFVNLDGRNSWFATAAVDAGLEERVGRHDIHPTGPLVGRGATPSGEAGAVEAEVTSQYAALRERLASAGLEAGRRALRLVPAGLRHTLAGGDLTLEFSLPAGSYATVVLRELVRSEPIPGEGADD